VYLLRTDRKWGVTYIVELKEKSPKYVGVITSDFILDKGEKPPLEGKIFLGKEEKGLLRSLLPTEEVIETYLEGKLYSKLKRNLKVLELPTGNVPILELGKEDLGERLLNWGLIRAFSVERARVYSFERDGELAGLLKTDSLDEAIRLIPLAFTERIFRQSLLKELTGFKESPSGVNSLHQRKFTRA
jgi:hypothetical protein